MGEGTVSRLVDSGLDEKEAQVMVTLAARPPMKASEVGQHIGITRMDSYNTLRRLQDRGLVKATVDKPMRFTSLSIDDTFQHLIHKEEQELRRLKAHREELKTGLVQQHSSNLIAQNEPTFSVVKERVHIHAVIERLVNDAESNIWLMLGKWGILHLVKTGALVALNEAVNRGVEVKALASLDRKTIRFFEKLHDTIEIRHSDSVSMHGCIVDGEVAVQTVSQEANPVGRGKDDAALVIEASDFLAAQTELVESAWATATSFKSATSRIEEGEIIEPLKINLGEGSFYRRLKKALAADVEDQHPQGDGWTNAILRQGDEVILPEPTLPTFEALGIDTSELMRSIGRRIGEEISVNLSDLESDEEFWVELKREWSELGMGSLKVVGEPPVEIRVENPGSCGKAPLFGGPFCHLDEGILEGIIESRFGISATAIERECTGSGDECCHFDISFVEIDT